MSVLKVEEKIAKELQQAGLLATPEEPQPREPDYGDLGQLTYLSCVIKEAMRVHTVSPYLPHHPFMDLLQVGATNNSPESLLGATAWFQLVTAYLEQHAASDLGFCLFKRPGAQKMVICSVDAVINSSLQQCVSTWHGPW